LREPERSLGSTGLHTFGRRSISLHRELLHAGHAAHLHVQVIRELLDRDAAVVILAEREVENARGILRKFVAERFVFTPNPAGGYLFRGEGDLGLLLSDGVPNGNAGSTRKPVSDGRFGSARRIAPSSARRARLRRADFLPPSPNRRRNGSNQPTPAAARREGKPLASGAARLLVDPRRCARRFSGRFRILVYVRSNLLPSVPCLKCYL
jgi:hypothetical protein